MSQPHLLHERHWQGKLKEGEGRERERKRERREGGTGERAREEGESTKTLKSPPLFFQLVPSTSSEASAGQEPDLPQGDRLDDRCVKCHARHRSLVQLRASGGSRQPRPLALGVQERPRQCTTNPAFCVTGMVVLS